MKLIWDRKMLPKSFDNWSKEQLWATYYHARGDTVNMAIKHAIKQELIKRGEWAI